MPSCDAASPSLLRKLVTLWLLTGLLLATGGPMHAQQAGAPDATFAAGTTDADRFAAACANCHGLDGRGAPDAIALLDTAIPDFTDCNFATREPDADWGSIIHQGGPVRGFSTFMPAFGEALTDDDIAAVLRHVRTFCTDAAWPRGELNLPRALLTEKAYPEDEAVWTMTVAADGPGSIQNEFVYERRIGTRSQMELKVPISLAEHPAGDWRFGAGDVGLGLKHTLAHNLDRGYILSAAAELVMPTGDESAGAGKGVAIFEPFVSYGQILPRDSFVQAQFGLEFPSDQEKAEREAFWRLVAGRTWTSGPHGRAWTPMLELVAARALEDGERTQWDVVPQVQISLNTRQHVLLNLGLRMPINERVGRQTQLMVYVLWDWFDGGLFDGW